MRGNASRDVYDKIRSDILSLALMPGEEISINRVAEEMGISRSPVRDALIRLSLESLVDIYPQRGCWVSLIDMERVDEERFLRHSLEKSVLSYFIEYSKPSDIQRLEYIISKQKEDAEADDKNAFFSSDDEMHMSIFQTARKERSWNIIARETGHYRRMRLLSFQMKGVYEKNIAQHEELVGALKEKNIQKALQIEGEHIFKLTFETGEIIRTNPLFFKEEKKNEIE